MNGNFYIPTTAYLKNVIHSVWQVDRVPKFYNETIIPKGIVEIIFDLGEHTLVEAKQNNKQYQLSRCFINGFNTCPIQLQLPKQQTFFGVQFHPVVVKHLFGVPTREFTNRSVDLVLLDSFFNSLWHQLAEKKSFDERVGVITKWLESKLIEIHPQEKLLDYYLGNHNHEVSTVTGLAKTLCYSPRHLSRKIYELTEMNTEEVLLYQKYLHAVHLIHSTSLSLTEIAYQCRFSDQSHFIKCFKAYSQLTPGEYKQVKSHLPGHFFENVR